MRGFAGASPAMLRLTNFQRSFGAGTEFSATVLFVAPARLCFLVALTAGYFRMLLRSEEGLPETGWQNKVASVKQNWFCPKRSPMKIPEARGATFRIVLSLCVLTLACFITYFTIVGIGKGEIYIGSKYGHGHTIYRTQNPQGFLIGVLFDCFMSALFFYLSVGEIIYTLNRKENKETAADQSEGYFADA
jgi:uncharacterized membrane protein YbhN (UPF0104 family)